MPGTYGYVMARWISLAYDRQFRAAISYVHFDPETGSSNLRFAWNTRNPWRDPGSWDLEDIAYGGEGNSLAFDSEDGLVGTPTVAYLQATNGDLKFARRISRNNWSTETVDTDGVVGLFTSLEFYFWAPNISYYDETNGDLKYAHYVP